MKGFDNLKKEYGLESQDFFRHLQVRHRLKTILTEDLTSDILKIFISIYKSGSGKKLISRLYKSFQDSSKSNTIHIKCIWEREGVLVKSEEEWEDICKLQWKTTNSHSWREFGWKNLMRFFITPVQKRHLGSGRLSYWHDIHDCLEHIFRMTVQFDVSAMCFGTIILHTQAITDKYLMKMLLIGAKKAITRKWLQPNAPTMEDWQETVQGIYTMEFRSTET